jgi:hypothetical protein
MHALPFSLEVEPRNLDPFCFFDIEWTLPEALAAPEFHRRFREFSQILDDVCRTSEIRLRACGLAKRLSRLIGKRRFRVEADSFLELFARSGRIIEFLVRQS